MSALSSVLGFKVQEEGCGLQGGQGPSSTQDPLSVPGKV